MTNLYQNKKIKLTSSQNLSSHLKTFTFSPGDDRFLPGQFYILGLPGYGEAPFTPTNFPDNKKIQFLIQEKHLGDFTSALFRLKKGDEILIRGPYGKSFPFEELKHKNIALIAGGCGLAPLKGALEYFYKNYKDYKQLQLFYGVGTPEEIAYKKSLEAKKDRVELLITVSNPNKNYKGNIGFIDKLISRNTILKHTAAILCGPPAMYTGVIKKLISLKVSSENIYVQLERRMHCGVGLCQHCTCGEKYVCTDGPIFRYDRIEKHNI